MTDGQDLASDPRGRNVVAPVWHTLVLISVLAALTILGWLGQRNARVHPLGSISHPRLVPLQIEAMIFEWATLVWVWFGIRRKGIRVRDLVGGRWPRIGSILVDIMLAVVLWLLWIGITKAANFLLGHTSDTIPFPGNLLEGLLAIIVAISAGICEEIVFRGYLQRQFRALTGSAALAVVLQAAVFGMPHVYQGARTAALASLYGILFGALAGWRRSLRPGILAHAWTDIAARLLRF